MTKEEIVQYVLNSPENTNPNVLNGMLEELSGGSQLPTYTFMNVSQSLTMNVAITGEASSISIDINPQESQEIEIPLGATTFEILQYRQS